MDLKLGPQVESAELLFRRMIRQLVSVLFLFLLLFLLRLVQVLLETAQREIE